MNISYSSIKHWISYMSEDSQISITKSSKKHILPQKKKQKEKNSKAQTNSNR